MWFGLLAYGTPVVAKYEHLIRVVEWVQACDTVAMKRLEVRNHNLIAILSKKV